MDETPASWTPSTADEKNYYDTLFRLADISNIGNLAGQSAVTFLARSRLSFSILKQVWDIAGYPKLNYLRREDFYVAMRLIAMAQASPGISISVERLKAESGNPLPLPRMQSVPPPPVGCVSKGMARSGGASMTHGAVHHSDPYIMSAQERSKYESLFPMYDSDRDGFVTGAEAVNLFSKSGLPREQLRQIWELSDGDGDSKLSLAEFCIGMHLIVCASKKGLAIPAAVPRSLALAGTGSGSATSPAQLRGASPSTSASQSPSIRPAPGVQSLSTPPAGLGFSSLGAATSSMGTEDAFSALSLGLPTKDPTTAAGSEPEITTSTLMTMEPDPSVLGPSLPTAQPQDKLTLSLPTDPPSAENDSTLDDSPNDMSSQPADEGLKTLAPPTTAPQEGTSDVPTTHSQALVIQSSSPNSMETLVQNLQAEKESLSSIVVAGKVEHMDNEQQLRGMDSELQTLQAELGHLRHQFQEQYKETAKLRTRVSQAAIERATLLAEIKACEASLHVQQGENTFLAREEAMIDGTRSALQSYSAILRRSGIPGESCSSQQPPAIGEEQASSPAEDVAEYVAERPQISPEPRGFESKTDTPPEPKMPAEIPPPPPNINMSEKRVVEDPFADMVSKKRPGDEDFAPSVRPEAGSPKHPMQSENEEKAQDGFDAFPPVSNAFESDPFAISGFSGNGLEDVDADDPFAVPDVAFSSVAAASSDGFDAFPPTTGAQFDAFGQNDSFKGVLEG